jgi:hypothetical protein
MNSKQKKVLLVGGILLVLMILFPPWEYFDNDSSGRSPAGYHFLLMRPALKSTQEMFGVPKLRVPDQVRVEVDLFQLIFQLAVTIPIVAGLLPLLADRRTIIKTGFGVLLICCGLFVLCFILWLEYSAATHYGSTPKHNKALQLTAR